MEGFSAQVSDGFALVIESIALSLVLTGADYIGRGLRAQGELRCSRLSFMHCANKQGLNRPKRDLGPDPPEGVQYPSARSLSADR